SSFESIAWACGLLAGTRRINVFCTVHVPLLHPIIAAKQMATVDHVGGGRLGVNVVCGWNEDEFHMFGLDKHEHDDRYAQGGGRSGGRSFVASGRASRRSISTGASTIWAACRGSRCHSAASAR